MNTQAMFSIVALVVGSLHAQASESDKQSENMKVSESMYAAFNRHDWEAFADHFADPLEALDPSYGKEYVKKTRSELVKKYSGMNQRSPDIRDDIVRMYTFENKVITEFISSGTMTDGTKWSLPICSVHTIENGKIIRTATYYDRSK